MENVGSARHHQARLPRLWVCMGWTHDKEVSSGSVMSAAALSITAGLYLIATWDYFTLINRPWMAGVFICYALANLCLLMDGRQ